MNKYRNKKIVVDNIKFDSILEARRYNELKLLLRAGKIQDLKLQPRFLLQEAFKKNGKTYRKIEYVADFMYKEDSKTIVEDVKGFATKDFKIKEKLFNYIYKDLELRLIK